MELIMRGIVLYYGWLLSLVVLRSLLAKTQGVDQQKHSTGPGTVSTIRQYEPASHPRLTRQVLPLLSQISILIPSTRPAYNSSTNLTLAPRSPSAIVRYQIPKSVQLTKKPRSSFNH
ncbi:hypothetical protein K469DRAFT_314645 [Zopfia rhizophila CBS 207.26]|uniref:Uncharacterized protein n=1 Tax=Zopfia rhizophila CBS 207.26 TaxID=1314779 RepID=A0A6A6EPG0_9PEZI|nr:hypothetical protein K469DRAFT_314645 [Zopfia rhizophila CBS 207.26]